MGYDTPVTPCRKSWLEALIAEAEQPISVFMAAFAIYSGGQDRTMTWLLGVVMRSVVLDVYPTDRRLDNKENRI